MKYRLALIPVLIFFAACSSQPQTETSHATGKPKSADEIREAEENKPPYVGMTKAQALARYGDPRKQTTTEEGEQWVYVLNFGEAVGKALIPFNFKPTEIRTGVLTFGTDGKVKKYQWDNQTGN